MINKEKARYVFSILIGTVLALITWILPDITIKSKIIIIAVITIMVTNGLLLLASNLLRKDKIIINIVLVSILLHSIFLPDFKTGNSQVIVNTFQSGTSSVPAALNSSNLKIINEYLKLNNLPVFEISPASDDIQPGQIITIQANSANGIHHIGYAWDHEKTIPIYATSGTITAPTTKCKHYLYFYAKDNSKDYNWTGWQKFEYTVK